MGNKASKVLARTCTRKRRGRHDRRRKKYRNSSVAKCIDDIAKEQPIVEDTIDLSSEYLTFYGITPLQEALIVVPSDTSDPLETITSDDFNVVPCADDRPPQPDMLVEEFFVVPLDAAGPSQPNTYSSEEEINEIPIIKKHSKPQLKWRVRFADQSDSEHDTQFLKPDAPPKKKRRYNSKEKTNKIPIIKKHKKAQLKQSDSEQDTQFLKPDQPDAPPKKKRKQEEYPKKFTNEGKKIKHIAARLMCEKRERLLERSNDKEVAHSMMPDSPIKKKRRKKSPERIPCPLMPGTPAVPPPRIPQKWELKKLARESSVSYKVEFVEEGEATTLPDSKPAECLITQNLFSESSSSPSKSENWICKGNLEEEMIQKEWSTSLNPGSEVEDEECLDGCFPRRRLDFGAMEDLPSELCEMLGSLDQNDDCALRELSQEELLTFDWSHDPQVFTGVRENFTGPAGPSFVTEGMSPFQIFTKIWDEDIINLIVNETNKYAANLLKDPNLKRAARLRKWYPITPQELWTFFGIMMLQSIVPIPVESEYWAPCLPYLRLNFNSLMACGKFFLIKRCLHFVDNKLCARGIPTKLTKIKPIVDHLNSKFSSLYLPEQELALDESLLLWKGKLSFAQLIATKAAQVGIKSYELCESRTGYLWKMLIHTGSKEDHNAEADVDEAVVKGVTSRIVLNLVRPLLNKGHTLVMDNFYNSPLLARTLKNQKTDVIGTMRLNRANVPDSLRDKSTANMQPGEVAFSQTHDLTIVVWRDARVVPLISTYHKVEVGGKEKAGIYRYKPKVVLDYNTAMGGVDKKDQLLQAFPIERIRNPVWYKKFFRRLFNVSIHNAFVMWQTANPKMAQRYFRVKLADEIIQRFRPSPIVKPPRPGHFAAKTGTRKSRCKWCALKKIDTCTVYKCEECNVNLCIIGCFRDYHNSMGLVDGKPKKTQTNEKIIQSTAVFPNKIKQPIPVDEWQRLNNFV